MCGTCGASVSNTGSVVSACGVIWAMLVREAMLRVDEKLTGLVLVGDVLNLGLDLVDDSRHDGFIVYG